MPAEQMLADKSLKYERSLNETDCPWNLTRFPDPFYIPTMLRRKEIDFLYWLAHSFYKGKGRVCELGCFLGGSTLPLISGMRSNPNSRYPLLTYDAFIMNEHGSAHYPNPYKTGENFRPLVEVYLQRYLKYIDFRTVTIPSSLSVEHEPELYPEQEPVEILFVDIAKEWGVHRVLLNTFGRHLLVGESILVQQDFRHFYTYWIPLHMFQLRNFFKPLHEIYSTVAFLYSDDMESKLAELWDPFTVPASDVVCVWEEVESYWKERGAEYTRMMVRINRAVHLADVGLCDASFETIDRLLNDLRRSNFGALEALLIGEIDNTISYVARKSAIPKEVARSRERLTQTRNRRELLRSLASRVRRVRKSVNRTLNKRSAAIRS